MNFGTMALFKVIVTLACVASVMTSSHNVPSKNKVTELLDTLKRDEEGGVVCEGATTKQALAPGVEKMFFGVDLTKLDFYDRETLRQPVLAMTCKREFLKAWNTQNCGEKFYARPDQISSISFDNSGSMSSAATVIESMSDVAKSFSASVSVSGSYGPVSGSASASYAKMSQDIAKNKYFYSVVEATETTATYSMRWDARLSDSANHSLPWGVDYDRNKRSVGYKRYKSYIRKFGTHHFDIGYYGGVVRMVVQTESSLTKQLSKSEIAAAATVKYQGLIASASVSVSMSKSQQSANSKFNSKSSMNIKYYGGNTNLLQKGDGLTKWQPSVRSNPYMMGGRLSPIYDRIEDKRMRENMEKATDDYLKETYYKVLKDEIDSYMDHFKHRDKDNILGKLKNFRASLVVGSAEDENRKVDEVTRKYNDIMEELAEEGKYGSSCQGHNDCTFSTYSYCLEGTCRCNINHVYSPGEKTCRQECENNEYGKEFVKYPYRILSAYDGHKNYNAHLVKGFRTPKDCEDYCVYEIPVSNYRCLSFNHNRDNGNCVFTHVAMNVPMGSELVDTSMLRRIGTVPLYNMDYYQRQCD